jgi:hypothetical protein
LSGLDHDRGAFVPVLPPQALHHVRNVAKTVFLRVGMLGFLTEDALDFMLRQPGLFEPSPEAEKFVVAVPLEGSCLVPECG